MTMVALTAGIFIGIILANLFNWNDILNEPKED